MYVQESLAVEYQRERLKKADEGRVARQVVALQKMERRRQRAERELLHVWQRVDHLRSMIGVAG